MAKVIRGLKELLSYAKRDFMGLPMFQDNTKYVKDCLWCQIVKGDYIKPNTIPGVIIANNPMDVMCFDFTKVDPSKDGKENILVLTDYFTRFSQAFVTPNQKVITSQKYCWTNGFMCMVFLHVYTAIKAIALTMKSCHIYMPCMELSSQPLCYTIHVEMLQLKD